MKTNGGRESQREEAGQIQVEGKWGRERRF